MSFKKYLHQVQGPELTESPTGGQQHSSSHAMNNNPWRTVSNFVNEVGAIEQLNADINSFKAALAKLGEIDTTPGELALVPKLEEFCKRLEKAQAVIKAERDALGEFYDTEVYHVAFPRS